MSTISFPDSVDELDDEMDIKDEDEEGDLFPLFSSWPWLLCSLFVGAFHYFWAWWKVIFFSFSLTYVVYLVYLLRKSLCFLTPFFQAPHMSYLQLYHFLPYLIIGVNYREINICIMLICCRDSASSKICNIIYCIENTFLDNIFCNLPVLRARPSRFVNKVERGLRIGL